MPHVEMKRERKKLTKGWKKMEKAFNRCVFLPASSSLSILFHYLCPLFCRQHCLCGKGSSETLWPGRDLKTPLMFCSEVLFRAKRRNISGCPINYYRLWNGITSPDWAAHWHCLHFPTKICLSNPKIPAAGEQQGDCFFDLSLLSYLSGISLFFSSLVTNFSRVWESFVSPSCCLKHPENSSDRENEKR